MKLIATILLVAAFSVSAHGPQDDVPELTKKQEEALNEYLHGVYNLNALEGPFPPYICMWSIHWEDYYYPVEYGIRHYLDHVPPNERKRIPSSFVMWWTVLDQLGCGDYDPLKIYH